MKQNFAPIAVCIMAIVAFFVVWELYFKKVSHEYSLVDLRKVKKQAEFFGKTSSSVKLDFSPNREGTLVSLNVAEGERVENGVIIGEVANLSSLNRSKFFVAAKKWKEAKANLKKHKERLKDAENKGRRVSRRELNQLKAAVGGAKSYLLSAETDIEKALRGAIKFEILSPLNCEIATLHKDLGEDVFVGEPLLSFVNCGSCGSVVFRDHTSEKVEYQDVLVSADEGLDRKYAANVVELPAEAQDLESEFVAILKGNCKKTVPDNLKVRINLVQIRKAPFIPTRAIDQSRNGSYVYVLKQDRGYNQWRARRTKIITGNVEGDSTEVMAGFTRDPEYGYAEVVVATSNLDRIRDGAIIESK